jgi:hypothetical protein
MIRSLEKMTVIIQDDDQETRNLESKAKNFTEDNVSPNKAETAKKPAVHTVCSRTGDYFSKIKRYNQEIGYWITNILVTKSCFKIL